VTKIVLFPVRFLFTAETGQVATNAVAAEHYLAGANPPAATLVTAALAWRLEPPSADQATALLSRELIPLYIQYLDDHIARLNAIDHHRLAGRFERWRARLLAPNLFVKPVAGHGAGGDRRAPRPGRCGCRRGPRSTSRPVPRARSRVRGRQ